MHPSLATLVAVASALLSTVLAQSYCGGQVTDIVNGTMNTFKVQYFNNLTLLTLFGLNNNNGSESYVLYCGEAPGTQALLSYNISPSTAVFKIPLQAVGVEGSYTSSYIELAGHRSAIAALATPQNIVSPCLQQAVASSAVVAYSETDMALYERLNGTFREDQQSSRSKDIWIPSSRDVDPLLRIEYIIAVSFFFNDTSNGVNIYTRIKNVYTTLQSTMAQIPVANRKRIGWVYYDFESQGWKIRNSLFTRGIITAAGGQPFPLQAEGEVPDNHQLSTDEIKTLLLNSQIVIDQTNFTGQATGSSPIARWRELAGFDSADMIPALANKQVYSLDNTVNTNGISDYDYRLASRPDLLLRDLIVVQYPVQYPYSLTFLNRNFSYGGEPGSRLTADNCNTVQYNSGDIQYVAPNPQFRGDPNPPPPLVGSGIYGASGGSGGSKKTGIVVAVVCVAAVLGAGFAFAFFKWGKRAKEDRFIELEEEMNNEIPLH
ncbi:hypothetical protein EDD11_006495 [Mortierella claussenii]|nr:hypothetical protein EDD11_006495 [Mortierella claussenii]